MPLRDITALSGIAMLLVLFSGPSWSQTRVDSEELPQNTSDESGEFWFTDVRPGVSDTENPAAVRGLNPQPEPPTNNANVIIQNPATVRGLNPQPEPPTTNANTLIQNPAAVRGLNPQPEPPTNNANTLIQNPAAVRGLNPQPEPPTNSANTRFANPTNTLGLNPQPEPPTSEFIIVPVESRQAFAALNGYDRARDAMSQYLVARIREGNTSNTGTLPNEVALPWDALVGQAARDGHRDEIDILAWSLIEDAMQTGNEETRLHAQQLHGSRANQTNALSRAAIARSTRATGLATGRRTYEPLQIPNEPSQNTTGDDAQLANVDMQNVLQRQQQTLQTMSNVSKMLHDTAMAVIRKMN